MKAVIKLTKEPLDVQTSMISIEVEGVVTVKFKADRQTKANLTGLIYSNLNQIEVPGTVEVK